jgi:hypothetical protein
LFLLLAIAVPVLFAAALLSKAKQLVLERQATDEAKALQQVAAGIPLVNEMAPTDFIPPISIVITDSQGHTMRVVVDEQGRQHAQPVPSLGRKQPPELSGHSSA